MAEKRRYFAMVCYLQPLAAENPKDLAEEGIPSGGVPDWAVSVAEVIEDIDFTAEEDWDRLGFSMMMAFQRRIRLSGWPKFESAGKPEPSGEPAPAAEQEASAPTPPAATSPEEDDPAPDGACWNCGGNLITTRNRTFCPSGCPEQSFAVELVDRVEREAADVAEPEDGGGEPELDADGPRSDAPPPREVLRSEPETGGEQTGRPDAPYSPNQEGGPPSSFPEGGIIPPTD